MTDPVRTDAVLLSNSAEHSGSLYSYAAEAMAEAAAGRPVTFIPFALADWDAYTHRVERAFADMGLELTSAHHAPDLATAILEAEVVMVGGGNTFRLLDTLQELDVLDRLADRVHAGTTTYLGASAGTSIAGPTIRTSNDMPIRHPRTLDALGVVPFQINAHFVDADPDSTFMGETREQRIEEFLEDNDATVFGLYEGSYLRIRGTTVTLHGRGRLFERTGFRIVADGETLPFEAFRRPRFDVAGWSSPLAAAWAANGPADVAPAAQA
ncbi:dipeptidase PepE [soil metagenome]